MRELTCLEVNKYEAPEAAVEEYQIDAVPFIADTEAPLARDERKIVAQLEQEMFKVKDKSLF